MKHLKTYHQHESVRSNLAKLGIVGSLMLPMSGSSKGDNKLPNNLFSKEWVKEHPKDGMEVVRQVSNLSNLRLKENQKDAKLSSILDEIQENLESGDSTKYQKLFNELTSHIQEKYNYNIPNKNVEELSQAGGSTSGMSLAEILGWLGSICLAVCAIPQAWMSFKDKHSEGISWAFLLLWAFGEVFALAYVYDKLDLPLLLNYATNILVLGVILYYKVNPKENN
jgi:uncharacterized protein with PQ loop repeat